MKALLIATGLISTACISGFRVPAASVVVITLDTTRADRLSPYGFGDAAMPALDRLAREGVVFDQATTVAPLTLPAHTSLLTGLLPRRHGVRENASAPLADAEVTLAEILQARGYRTAAFVGSAVLDPDRGLRQGFLRYDKIANKTWDGFPLGRGPERPASAVIDDALRWLADVDEAPFFLWTHLYDPHQPYNAPEPFASRHDPYIAEIAFADSQIARLLEALDRRRLLDRTIVIVTADHGESLGDHGERDHGVFLYESVLRVPLIVRARGIAPRRVGDVVRIVDVMPTVLDLLRLPAPALDGISLIELMQGTSGPEREVCAESLFPQRFGWSPLFALRSDRFKFIDAPRPELYDLRLDPFEQRNIFDQRRRLAVAMQARLRTLVDHAPATSVPAPVDDELQTRLAALGYAGRAPAIPAGSAQLPDPKDCAGIFELGRCQ